MSPVSATTVSSAAASARAANTALADAVHAADASRSANSSRTVESRAPAIRLGSWQLESLLGESPLARVYRARYADAFDHSHGSYAIKVLRERWHNSPPALARLRREAIVGRCVANRHVISVLTAHVHQSPYYVVMPCLTGWPVAALLQARERIELPQALWIARQAAEGLDALHTCGYLHGDVKPSNLFVSPAGHVTLIDLGCARRADDNPTLDDQTLIGTPAYLAPEVLAGGCPDARSDLYSLGITLFEMLCGRLPWDETDVSELIARKRGGPTPSVRAFAPQLPSEVAQLIGRLTAGQPLRRPQWARELVHSLVKLEIATLALRLPR